MKIILKNLLMKIYAKLHGFLGYKARILVSDKKSVHLLYKEIEI
jgi:hypothetical protein